MTSYMLVADPNNTKVETCLFFRKCKCDTCKKTFEADVEMYSWKRSTGKGIVYYCSYSCFRKWEEEYLRRDAAKIRRAFKEAALYDVNGNKLEDRRGRRRIA